MVRSTLGPVPFELDEMYPLAQSVFPSSIDMETLDYVNHIEQQFLQSVKVVPLEKYVLIRSEKSLFPPIDFDVRRISAVADMQFGPGASKALFKGKLSIVKSKRTGKIRNIYCNNTHVLSMRAEDGLFTLKIAGGRLLHKQFKYPLLRIIVKDEAVPFIKEGKSVFARFVYDCDPDLRPFDECVIVDTNDTLLAVGRTLLNRVEMRAFKHGMAVKTRESIKESIE